MSKKKVKMVGTSERPRLVIYRSIRYMHAQLVDDVQKKVLMGITNKSKDVQTALKDKMTKTEAAAIVGKILAKKAKDKNINKVIFDRNGYIYHGRVKALADGARDGGLEF